MFRGEKVVGIVPARGGSKRLPGKNIAVVAGKPLLGWTLDASLSSSYIDKVVLTTDDSEIARVGRTFKVDEIQDRPKSLAEDKTSIYQVVLHVLDTLNKRKEHYGFRSLWEDLENTDIFFSFLVFWFFVCVF